MFRIHGLYLSILNLSLYIIKFDLNNKDNKINNYKDNNK